MQQCARPAADTALIQRAYNLGGNKAQIPQMSRKKFKATQVAIRAILTTYDDDSCACGWCKETFGVMTARLAYMQKQEDLGGCDAMAVTVAELVERAEEA
mmetsp:Transcript_88043/g.285001  ORF Transcript_88043/g.285001 Transcript_88043/m.285001 type:complete len:100 (-) Transcript_88043:146-445(-)